MPLTLEQLNAASPAEALALLDGLTLRLLLPDHCNAPAPFHSGGEKSKNAVAWPCNALQCCCLALQCGCLALS